MVVPMVKVIVKFRRHHLQAVWLVRPRPRPFVCPRIAMGCGASTTTEGLPQDVEKHLIQVTQVHLRRPTHGESDIMKAKACRHVAQCRTC